MALLFTAAALLALLSAGSCEEKAFLQRAGTAFNSRPYKSILNVTNGEKFGGWTWPEMCPETFYAVGFSLRVKAQTPAHAGVPFVWGGAHISCDCQRLSTSKTADSCLVGVNNNHFSPILQTKRQKIPMIAAVNA